jgi:hypothetical protein
VVVLLLTPLTASVAQASTRQSDAKASQAYLSAYDRYLKAVIAAIPSEEAIGHGFAAQLRAQCPEALAGAPDTKALETVALLVIALLDEVQTPLMNALSGDTIRLRWSSRSVTHAIHVDALLLGETAPVVNVPAVCQDLRSWSSSRYRRLPSGFPPDPKPGFYSADGIIVSLEHYEGPGLRGYSKRVRRLEVRAETLNNDAFGRIATPVDEALGVHVP